MELPKPMFPSRVIYVYAMAIIFILLGAFFWFCFHYMFWIIQPITANLTYNTFGTNTTEYEQVDTFFQAYDSYALILALLAMMVFVFVYSQRRGRDV